MKTAPIVIVGSGLAGYTLARELRKLDAEVPLVIISSDHGGFYSKPMLSNALGQKKSADALLLKSPEQMAGELKAEVRAHAVVDSIDTQRKHILLDSSPLAYSKLVLALGADTIRLPLQGDAASAVLSVNDLDDYKRFRDAIGGKQDIAILGAGLIGCEFANDLVASGHNVHVIDLAPQPLGRLLPPQAGAYMQRKLEAVGITFHLATSALLIERADGKLRLSLADGGFVEVDTVLSAVGLKSRIALAQAAGIKVNRGIVVDEFLQTSARDVYALGDCAEVMGKVLPFVMPIMQGARALAPTLAGKPTAVNYPVMPVAVKTPACPAVVAPPEPGALGEWQVEEAAEGVKATFLDVSGKLLGYALLGAATSEKNALTQQMQA